MYRQISPSSTLLLNEQSSALEKEGRQVFRFGFGQSPFPISAVLKAALIEHAHRKEYTQVQGLEALRTKVAEYHSAFEKRPICAEQIFIAPGSKALLYTIMCAYTHAAVLIPAPAWVSYAPQAELIGHATYMLQTNFAQRYRITPDILEKSLAEASQHYQSLLVVLNSPGNPDGLCYTQSELQALTVVLEKYQAMVISDEIYAPLQHDNQHVSIAKYYPKGTFVTSGLSKWAGAGGWRLGIAILPDECASQLKDAMLGIASETYSCASSPIQHAAITAYSDNVMMLQYVKDQRTILSALGKYIHKAVINAGLNAHAPEGGFYLLLDFSAYRQALKDIGLATDIAVCKKVLEDVGVALLPGVSFGLPPEALCARLAYVDFDGRQALEDIRLSDWSDTLTVKHAKKMSEGIESLGRYLKQLT
ncbi:aminotransferase class I/II-fold pyridoxal phosphate-dependent enzyme [uncultured Paraglaciecola sp.]|jgi:aspartate aminotransferase|uniref:pyridoxal phosphate-dependent aminotransferase n=1 Tax=uncultured Paraglaciecola sp. TaxID=1765024 RepID=UPI0025FA7F4C|nr:aminotransferase class I/II-fold pyridoxal phosphate-dependent enzyme [uncultured Paraglaciecola sp.]